MRFGKNAKLTLKCNVNENTRECEFYYCTTYIYYIYISSYNSYILNSNFLFVRFELKSGKIRSNSKYGTKKMYIILLPTLLYCALAFYVRHFK